MEADKPSRAGQPGEKGAQAEGATGGTGGAGGAGGAGGDPAGTGGVGGTGGAVYVDSDRVRRWIRRVWIGYIALGVAVTVSLYLVAHEHSSRVAANTKLSKENADLIAQHERVDIGHEAEGIQADCNRARDFRRIALANGYFTTPQGRADLLEYVRHASRIGCIP